KALDATDRWRIRQEKAKPLVDKLHQWMLAQRLRVPDGSGTAKALDYSLKRWVALTRYLDDGRVPIDNNHIEQQIRPVALGRKDWLFAGSLRAGKRAAAVMSLIQSANLNGHVPYAYLKDVLTRLPTHPNSRIEELLPHNWQPTPTASLKGPPARASTCVHRTVTRARHEQRFVLQVAFHPSEGRIGSGTHVHGLNCQPNLLDRELGQ